MNSISFIGTGYVGLTSSLCFANAGLNVMCYDIDPDKINKLANGIPTIFEADLEDYLQRNLIEKINFTMDFEQILNHSDYLFVCVPTPQNNDGTANLTFINQVIENIITNAKTQKKIIIKSTVPVGTNYNVQETINKTSKIKHSVISNPEFLREGKAIWDFNNPDRVVIGGEDQIAIENIEKIYRTVTKTAPILKMNWQSSELTKYAANSFLATKISFINEISRICEMVGADVNEVANGMGMDQRIGKEFLNSGIGWGGSCFPKDVSALLHTGKQYLRKLKILDAAVEVNQDQKTYFISKIKDYYLIRGGLGGKTIGCLGLSFKPGTDDTRDSPAVEIIQSILESGASVKIFDPEASIPKHLLEKYTTRITKESTIENTFVNSEGLIILTEWPEFNSIDLNQNINQMNQKVVFDGRNILKKEMMPADSDLIQIGK
ncbi:MAG: UDP-glucose dehydrogenase family protein [Patescibacteria group bacterium]